jgi:crotonobetainyl-CoA:carnitine CoA-transferase CaiB-like acyl-CoA transferase
MMARMSALRDLRVLDFSRVLAGPLSAMLLGDLGATVLKVERPGSGDDTRAWGPPHAGDGQATYFHAVNRNKRSVVADLRSPADVAALRALAREADVVVENFRPGVMDRLGLGDGDLRPDNPGLVFCSITGFGAGAGAALPGYDLLVQALGGLMSITGDPEGEPQKVGVALVDVVAGLFATVGILAALRHREATGLGQRVEVDLLSSLLAALVNQGSAFTEAGVVGRRMGNAHPSIAPYDLYAAADGPLVLAVGNDAQFRATAGVLGAPGLADERASPPTRRGWPPGGAARGARAAARARPAAAWIADLTAAGVPAGQVNDIAGAFALAERLGLGPVVDVPAAGGGVARGTRNPIGLSATPADYRPRRRRFRGRGCRRAGRRSARARVGATARAGTPHLPLSALSGRPRALSRAPAPPAPRAARTPARGTPRRPRRRPRGGRPRA